MNQIWKPLDFTDGMTGEQMDTVVRLNALGSLYFFEKFVLQRTKLSDKFHKPIVQRLETDIPRYLLEMPRDHYKTVIVTEGRTMWLSLPFSEKDEAGMRELGYGDEWIAWMKRIHNPARRTLIVSEIIGNAIKIGKRVNWHFSENHLFKHIFKEILPDAKCTWTDESKQQKCATRGPQGEGTFDFMGVGGALQSRHYSDVVEDDVIGKEALESELVMLKTIDYHRLLIGAFESYRDAHWTVVNNRWAPNDLSGWIRDNQMKGDNKFVIESHSALGGCCDEHPSGTPIFPEEFTVETLAEIREIQGPYFFSHQYLNLPVAPEDCIFNKDWIRYYHPVPSPYNPERHWLRHDVRNGEVIKDVDPRQLMLSMIVDPNHAGASGRARHAIVVTGVDPESDRLYLLDLWARSASYDDLMSNVYSMAKLWGLREFWLETVAAQKYLKYHIEYRNKIEGRTLNVRPLKSDTGANAKRIRIESLEPIFRSQRFWARSDQHEFLTEYFNYPGSRTVDILDCLGYATQTWNAVHAKKLLELVEARKNRHNARKGVTGY